MARQDISSKVMLRHNDVFSDIINGLLFGEPYIDENKLKDVIPESAYEDYDCNLRSMERDLLKEHDFKQLKYPVDALDMLYAYTKDEHYEYQEADRKEGRFPIGMSMSRKRRYAGWNWKCCGRQ